MNAIISIRKIANGYLVGTNNSYPNGLLGGERQEETFYPSISQFLGDVEDIVQRALDAAERSEGELKQALNQRQSGAAQQIGGRLS